MEDYEKGIVLGEGTFGSVVRAVHKKACPSFAEFLTRGIVFEHQQALRDLILAICNTQSL